MNTPRSVCPLPVVSGRRRAFTLIELLTVIAIIGILAAIIIPVVGSVRQKARQAQCASNLRQTAAAYMAFMTDNKNRLPNNKWNTSGPATPAYNVGYINLGTSQYMGAPAKDAHVPAEVSPLALGNEFTTLYAHKTYPGFYKSTSYWPNPHVWGASLYMTNLKVVVNGVTINMEPSQAAMLGVVDHDFLITSGANGVYLWNWAPDRFEAYGGTTTPFAYFDGHVANCAKQDIATKWCPDTPN